MSAKKKAKYVSSYKTMIKDLETALAKFDSIGSTLDTLLEMLRQMEADEKENFENKEGDSYGTAV